MLDNRRRLILVTKIILTIGMTVNSKVAKITDAARSWARDRFSWTILETSFSFGGSFWKNICDYYNKHFYIYIN